MYVRRLELTDFRSYGSLGVDLEPGPVVLVGPNGVGKTNFIEAIGYVATLASHRVAGDAPLVRQGARTAVIRCRIVHDRRELLVELGIEPGRANRVRLGSSTLRRARDVIGALRLVVFAPEDIALVKGDPAERRRYLDELLTARQPRYAGVRADYERVLKQRNALLRTAYLTRKARGSAGSRDGSGPGGSGNSRGSTGSGAGDLSTLDVWDEHLARHGAELLAGRMRLVAALGPHVVKAYDAVSAGQGTAVLAYRSSLGTDLPDGVPELRARLAAALVEARPSEVERGQTLVGPHRDELALNLGEFPVKGYASHGESWCYALALRLAGYELLRADGIEPVLVLDDVFAELDEGRRDRLAELVRGASQVLVTCAVEADVPPALRGTRYRVGGGEVHRG